VRGDPRGNHIASFAWGLGNVSNNITKTYSLWKGVSIAREERITKLVVLQDSMIVIWAIIDRWTIGNNALNVLISRIINLLAEFEEVAIYHIKHKLNSMADYWAQLGSHLSEGTLSKMGQEGSTPYLN
jgi:ribonuclease HI